MAAFSGIAFLFALLAPLSGFVTHGSEIRNVELPMGVLLGMSCPLVPDITSFRGVPYGIPPVGDLRFRPSILEDRDFPGGVLNATELGNVCGAPCDSSGDPTAHRATFEDCLNMNIWVPMESKNFGDLAVSVYIHGGLNNGCNGNDAHLDGCSFAQSTQSIRINLNYRIGAPGFLAHPGTYEESNTTGNWALHDHQTALKWVKNYIQYFGGNASKILVHGGSSGASMVAQHMIVESSQELFNSAITQSATCYEALTLEEAYAQTSNISLAVGCPGDLSDEDLQCLRQVTVDELTNALINYTSQANCYAYDRFPAFSSVVDGNFLKEQVVEAIMGGRFNRVPFMVGTNKDEGNFFIEFMVDDYLEVTEEDLIEFLGDIFLDANITQLINLYPIEEFARHEYPEYSRFSAVLTDIYVRCPAYKLLEAYSQFPEIPLYNYMFFHTPSCPTEYLYMGCTHGDELIYVFGNMVNVRFSEESCNYTEVEVSMSNSLMYAWSQMAKTGVPRLEYGAEFPIWNRTDQMAANLDLESSSSTNDISSRCEAFQAIVDEYVQSGRPGLSHQLKVTYGSRAMQ